MNSVGQTITLSEWETAEPIGNEILAGRFLDNSEVSKRVVAQLAKSKRIELTELRNGLRVRSFSLVGVAQQFDTRCQLQPRHAEFIDPLSACKICNGKIEAPAVLVDEKDLAVWDFAQDISSTECRATTGPDLDLINFPTRATTGSNWDGSEMNWTHRPDQYSAIHFHEDDIYDFGWATDFTFTVPNNMPSGIYVMRLECDEHYDAVPFFISLGRCKVLYRCTYLLNNLKRKNNAKLQSSVKRHSVCSQRFTRIHRALSEPGNG